jgi:hypothetical protein
VDTYRKAAAEQGQRPAISHQIIDVYRSAKNLEAVRKEVDAAVARCAPASGQGDVGTYLMLASVYEKGRLFAEEAGAG